MKNNIVIKSTTDFELLNIYSHDEVPAYFRDEKERGFMRDLYEQFRQSNSLRYKMALIFYTMGRFHLNNIQEAALYLFYFEPLWEFYNCIFSSSYHDHVYLISDGHHLKIGRSHNVEKRLQAIQAENPTELKIIDVIPFRGCYESILHKHFRKLRVRGEWFRHSNLIVDFFGKANRKTDFSLSDRGIHIDYFRQTAVAPAADNSLFANG